MNAGAQDAEARDLAALEDVLGHRFRERSLLELALHHASYAHEVEDALSNERLEFLGDAVIGLVVAELLYAAHPDWREGELTRGLHALVDRGGLAKVARTLGLGAHLQLGRTEQRSRGESKASILSDAMEAVLGAMYLDGGLEPVRALARRMYADVLAPEAPPVERDPKTRLQEWVMSETGTFPVYDLVRDSGTEGDMQRFTVRVSVGGEQWAEGTARSKRAAERAAAERALARAESGSG